MLANTTNRYSVYAQFVPAHWVSREAKYCENCMLSFIRNTCHCKLDALTAGREINYAEFSCNCPKYCADCVSRLLLPLDLQDYKDTLPTEAQQRHAHHLPHYDNSLLPREQRRVFTSSAGRRAGLKRRKIHDYGDWYNQLVKAFAERGQLSSADIQDIIGVPGAPVYAIQLCYNRKFPLERIGWLPPTPGIKGHGLAVYQLRVKVVEVFPPSPAVAAYIAKLEAQEEEATPEA